MELVGALEQLSGPGIKRAARADDVVFSRVGRARLARVDQDEVDGGRLLVARTGADRVAEAVIAGAAVEERVARVGVDDRAGRRGRLGRRIVKADDAVDDLVEMEVVAAIPVDLETLTLVVRVA